jgi:hypothetical protein
MKNDDLKLYNDLMEVPDKLKYKKKYFKDVETVAKCPFKIINVQGYTD